MVVLYVTADLYVWYLDKNSECAVCREEYTLNDQMKKLPCNHDFHPNCVDQWLEMVGFKKWLHVKAVDYFNNFCYSIMFFSYLVVFLLETIY